jgi:hypothetical protein
MRREPGAPKTPEDALKAIDMPAEQRAELVTFMREEFPMFKRAVEMGNRPLQWSLTERLQCIVQARAALEQLTQAIHNSFRHNLFDATKTRREKAQVSRFLHLLPVMTGLVGRITEKGVRERWAGVDGRSARKEWTPYETDIVCWAVGRAGFNIDPPDAAALDLMRRVLSYLIQKPLTVSAVRKRLEQIPVEVENSCAE